jgi:hypothetical protein
MLVLAIAATALAVPSVAAWALLPWLTSQAIRYQRVRVWKVTCFTRLLLPWALMLLVLEWIVGVVALRKSPFVEVVVLAIFCAVVAAYLYDLLKGAGQRYWKALHDALQAAAPDMTQAQREIFNGDRQRLLNFSADQRRATLERILSAGASHSAETRARPVEQTNNHVSDAAAQAKVADAQATQPPSPTPPPAPGSPKQREATPVARTEVRAPDKRQRGDPGAG